MIRVKIAEPYKDPAVIFLSDILLCSCPTSKMSCTTQPFLHRIALGKYTLLVPNNPWDLISAPLLTVRNLSVHFKTFQTNPSAYNHSRYEIGKGALARAGSGDPIVCYGKPIFSLLFHIIFRKQSVCSDLTTGKCLIYSY